VLLKSDLDVQQTHLRLTWRLKTQPRQISGSLPLNQRGLNLGRVFNSRWGRACLYCIITIITKTVLFKVENLAQKTFRFSPIIFPFGMDKLKLTGQNLGRVINSRWGAARLTKTDLLKVENLTQKTFPFAFVLSDSTQILGRGRAHCYRGQNFA
jgi:hypothetical protein